MSFPCSCSRAGCANPYGRVEFNAARVRAHFIRTLLQHGLAEHSATDYYNDVTGSADSVDYDNTGAMNSVDARQALDKHSSSPDTGNSPPAAKRSRIEDNHLATTSLSVSASSVDNLLSSTANGFQLSSSLQAVYCHPVYDSGIENFPPAKRCCIDDSDHLLPTTSLVDSMVLSTDNGFQSPSSSSQAVYYHSAEPGDPSVKLMLAYDEEEDYDDEETSSETSNNDSGNDEGLDYSRKLSVVNDRHGLTSNSRQTTLDDYIVRYSRRQQTSYTDPGLADSLCSIAGSTSTFQVLDEHNKHSSSIRHTTYTADPSVAASLCSIAGFSGGSLRIAPDSTVTNTSQGCIVTASEQQSCSVIGLSTVACSTDDSKLSPTSTTAANADRTRQCVHSMPHDAVGQPVPSESNHCTTLDHTQNTYEQIEDGSDTATGCEYATVSGDHTASSFMQYGDAVAAVSNAIADISPTEQGGALRCIYSTHNYAEHDRSQSCYATNNTTTTSSDICVTDDHTASCLMPQCSSDSNAVACSSPNTQSVVVYRTLDHMPEHDHQSYGPPPEDSVNVLGDYNSHLNICCPVQENIRPMLKNSSADNVCLLLDHAVDLDSSKALWDVTASVPITQNTTKDMCHHKKKIGLSCPPEMLEDNSNFSPDIAVIDVASEIMDCTAAMVPSWPGDNDISDGEVLCSQPGGDEAVTASMSKGLSTETLNDNVVRDHAVSLEQL